MFRHIALTLLLLLNVNTAKWHGAYIRGSASAFAVNGKGNVNLSFAGGYGTVLPGYFSQGLYLGLDAELINIKIGLGDEGSWSVDPKLLLRIGAPKTLYLPYIATSLAAYKYGDKHLFTGGARAGIDFDFITSDFFWGINIDWSYTFNAPGENFSVLTSGFTFGYRF